MLIKNEKNNINQRMAYGVASASYKVHTLIIQKNDIINKDAKFVF